MLVIASLLFILHLHVDADDAADAADAETSILKFEKKSHFSKKLICNKKMLSTSITLFQLLLTFS